MNKSLLMIVLLAPALAAAAPGAGPFVDLGVGRAEAGDGARMSLGVGYTSTSGFGVYLSRQALRELPFAVTTINTGTGASSPTTDTEYPEIHSTAVFASYRWLPGGRGDWALTAMLGLHRWQASADFPRSGRLDAQATDPAARLELTRALGPSVSFGVAIEDFRVGSRDDSRGSAFLRYTFGSR